MEHFIWLSLELPQKYLDVKVLYSAFSPVLIIRAVCFGEVSSAGSSAPGENLVNCERWMTPNLLPRWAPRRELSQGWQRHLLMSAVGSLTQMQHYLKINCAGWLKPSHSLFQCCWLALQFILWHNSSGLRAKQIEWWSKRLNLLQRNRKLQQMKTYQTNTSPLAFSVKVEDFQPWIQIAKWQSGDELQKIMRELTRLRYHIVNGITLRQVMVWACTHCRIKNIKQMNTVDLEWDWRLKHHYDAHWRDSKEVTTLTASRLK